MVLSPRPIDESQHRMEDLSRRISHMALWTRCIRRLDVNRFPPMGPWKTYVPLTLPSQLAPEGRLPNLRSGLWEEHYLVCHFLLIMSLIAGTHVDLVPQS
jgi:hypothetical protein